MDKELCKLISETANNSSGHLRCRGIMKDGMKIGPALPKKYRIDIYLIVEKGNQKVMERSEYDRTKMIHCRYSEGRGICDAAGVKFPERYHYCPFEGSV